MTVAPFSLLDTRIGDRVLDGPTIAALLAEGGSGGTVPVGDLLLAHNSLIIGNSLGAGAPVIPTGDVTIDDAGVTAIGDGKVTSAMLANGAGVAALLAAGAGASASYTKATTGVQTLLAGAAGDRSVIIIVTIDETFANGDGAQPTFSIGQTGTAAKFAATGAFTGATAGAVKTFAGTLTGTDALIITAVAGTGTTETGGLSVTVLALPV